MEKEELLDVIDERILELRSILNNASYPNNAFHNPEAERDLISYINMRLSLIKEEDEKDEEPSIETTEPMDSAELERLLAMPVDKLNLTVRMIRNLQWKDITTVRQLISYDSTALRKLPTIGPWTLNIIKEALAEHGLKLKG